MAEFKKCGYRSSQFIYLFFFKRRSSLLKRKKKKEKKKKKSYLKEGPALFVKKEVLQSRLENAAIGTLKATFYINAA